MTEKENLLKKVTGDFVFEIIKKEFSGGAKISDIINCIAGKDLLEKKFYFMRDWTDADLCSRITEVVEEDPRLSILNYQSSNEYGIERIKAFVFTPKEESDKDLKPLVENLLQSVRDCVVSAEMRLGKISAGERKSLEDSANELAQKIGVEWI